MEDLVKDFFINHIVIIIQVVLFITWIVLVVYFYFEMRRKIKALAAEYNATIPMECKSCHYKREYTYDEYLKIIRKPRNEIQKKTLGKTSTKLEYRFRCEGCNEKHYHKIVYDEVQLPEAYTKKNLRIIVTGILKILGLSIFIVICFAISEKI